MDEATLIIVAIGGLIALLFATIFVVIVYSGLLHSVIVGAGKPPIQNLKVAYKFGRGPYKNVGEVFTEACIVGPENCRTFGAYYDDPEQVPADRLRWAVGCVLAEGKEDPESHVVEKCRKEGFKFFHFPCVTNCVKTSFPYYSPLSIYMAIFKVYPELSRYITEKKLCAHPFLEVYSGSTIHFLAPLARQDEFYVPESLEEFVSDIDNETGEEVENSTERGQGDSSMKSKPIPSEGPVPGPSGEHRTKKMIDPFQQEPGEATPPVETPLMQNDHTYAAETVSVKEKTGNVCTDTGDALKLKYKPDRAKTEEPMSKVLEKQLNPTKENPQARRQKAASVSRVVPGNGPSSRIELLQSLAKGAEGAIQEDIVTSSRSSKGDSGLTSGSESRSESDISNRNSQSNTTSEASSYSLLTATSEESSFTLSENSWDTSRLTEFSDSGSEHDITASTETSSPPTIQGDSSSKLVDHDQIAPK